MEVTTTAATTEKDGMLYIVSLNRAAVAPTAKKMSPRDSRMPPDETDAEWK